MNKSLATLLSNDVLNSNFVGFDRIFDTFSTVSASAYPPHNIIRVDDDTREIEFALAGFSSDDLTVEIKDNMLTIIGEKTEKEEDGREYVWHGISSRKFIKQFSLTDYWKVDNAAFNDGILTLVLHREVPEELKPRLIQIESKSK